MFFLRPDNTIAPEHLEDRRPWTVIWTAPRPQDGCPQVMQEYDFLCELFEPLGGLEVSDIDREGRPLWQHVCNRALVVYGGNRNREKAAQLLTYLKKFRGKNFVLIHTSDESLKHPMRSYRLAPKVWRNYQRKRCAAHVETFPIGYTLGKRRPFSHPPRASSQRRYVWGFAGEISRHKPHRFAMLRDLKDVKENYFVTTEGFEQSVGGLGRGREGAAAQSVSGDLAGQALGAREYVQLLEDCVFTPCPRGNRSLDCFRNYEAAMWGSIPVVVSSQREFQGTFGYASAPFLHFESWALAALEMQRLVQSPDELERVQRRVVQWWEDQVRGHQSRLKSYCLGDLETCLS